MDDIIKKVEPLENSGVLIGFLFGMMGLKAA